MYRERGHARDNYGAIADLNLAIRLNPNDSQAHYYRAFCRGSLDDELGSYLDKEKAVELDPHILDYDMPLEQQAESIRRFTNGLTVSDLLTSRGWLRREQNDFQGALNDFNNAIRRTPRHAIAYNNRGVVYGCLGDRNKAMSDYNMATQIDPDLVYPYTNRGEIYFELGLYDMAMAEFSQSLRIMPDYQAAIAGIAVTLYILGNTDEAKKLWKTLLQQNENYKCCMDKT